MAPRWSGTAKIEGESISHVRFESRGAGSSAWVGARKFVLQTDDGPIEIDLSNDEVKILPESQREGTWGDVESDWRAAPFASSAPGPHVRVKLTSGTIKNGDAVIVSGTADGSSRVRATIVATGEGAADAIAERAPPPAPHRVRVRPPMWFALFGLALAVGIAGLAMGIPFSPATLDLGALAIVVFAFALHRAARGALVFRSVDGRVDARPFGWAFHIPVGITLAFFGIAVAWGDWPGHMNEGRQQNGSTLGLLMWSVYLACLFVDLVRSGRHSARLAHVVLTAPRRGERWRAITGIVRTKEETKPAVYSLLEEEWREGSGSNPRTETQHQAPFAIALENGEVRVEPKRDAWWATDIVESTGKSASPAKEKVVIERADVPNGAHVVAVGRVHSENDHDVLAPTGPESLVMFATDSRMPRAVLRLRVAMWVLALVVVGAASIACAAFAVWQPGMPPSNMPDSN